MDKSRSERRTQRQAAHTMAQRGSNGKHSQEGEGVVHRAPMMLPAAGALRPPGRTADTSCPLPSTPSTPTVPLTPHATHRGVQTGAHAAAGGSTRPAACGRVIAGACHIGEMGPRAKAPSALAEPRMASDEPEACHRGRGNDARQEEASMEVMMEMSSDCMQRASRAHAHTHAHGKRPPLVPFQQHTTMYSHNIHEQSHRQMTHRGDGMTRVPSDEPMRDSGASSPVRRYSGFHASHTTSKQPEIYTPTQHHHHQPPHPAADSTMMASTASEQTQPPHFTEDMVEHMSALTCRSGPSAGAGDPSPWQKPPTLPRHEMVLMVDGPLSRAAIAPLPTPTDTHPHTSFRCDTHTPTHTQTHTDVPSGGDGACAEEGMDACAAAADTSLCVPPRHTRTHTHTHTPLPDTLALAHTQAQHPTPHRGVLTAHTRAHAQMHAHSGVLCAAKASSKGGEGEQAVADVASGKTPRSMEISGSENRILRIPDVRMMLRQQQGLHGMLQDIFQDPNGFQGYIHHKRAEHERLRVNGERCASPVDVTYRSGRMANYRVVRPVGRGRFSTVYQAFRVRDSVPCAVKHMKLGVTTDKSFYVKCHKEVGLLRTLSHPNIVRYFDSFLEGDSLFIVLEWAGGGDLKALIKRHRAHTPQPMPMPEARIWSVFAQVSDAIRHMHRKRILHRDIKPSNVFVTAEGKVKLGDLGLGRYLDTQSVMAFSQVGTPLYMSPEVLRGEGHDFASDIWSLGCMLYELATLRSPFEERGLTLEKLFVKIVKGDYKPVPIRSASWGSYHPRLSILVDQLLRTDASARLCINRVASASLVACAQCTAEQTEEWEAAGVQLLSTGNDNSRGSSGSGGNGVKGEVRLTEGHLQSARKALGLCVSDDDDDGVEDGDGPQVASGRAHAAQVVVKGGQRGHGVFVQHQDEEHDDVHYDALKIRRPQGGGGDGGGDEEDDGHAGEEEGEGRAMVGTDESFSRGFTTYTHDQKPHGHHSRESDDDEGGDDNCKAYTMRELGESLLGLSDSSCEGEDDKVAADMCAALPRAARTRAHAHTHAVSKDDVQVACDAPPTAAGAISVPPLSTSSSSAAGAAAAPLSPSACAAHTHTAPTDTDTTSGSKPTTRRAHRHRTRTRSGLLGSKSMPALCAPATPKARYSRVGNMLVDGGNGGDVGGVCAGAAGTTSTALPSVRRGSSRGVLVAAEEGQDGAQGKEDEEEGVHVHVRTHHAGSAERQPQRMRAESPSDGGAESNDDGHSDRCGVRCTTAEAPPPASHINDHVGESKAGAIASCVVLPPPLLRRRRHSLGGPITQLDLHFRRSAPGAGGVCGGVYGGYESRGGRGAAGSGGRGLLAASQEDDDLEEAQARWARCGSGGSGRRKAMKVDSKLPAALQANSGRTSDDPSAGSGSAVASSLPPYRDERCSISSTSDVTITPDVALDGAQDLSAEHVDGGDGSWDRSVSMGDHSCSYSSSSSSSHGAAGFAAWKLSSSSSSAGGSPSHSSVKGQSLGGSVLRGGEGDGEEDVGENECSSSGSCGSPCVVASYMGLDRSRGDGPILGAGGNLGLPRSHPHARNVSVYHTSRPQRHRRHLRSSQDLVLSPLSGGLLQTEDGVLLKREGDEESSRRGKKGSKKRGRHNKNDIGSMDVTPKAVATYDDGDGMAASPSVALSVSPCATTLPSVGPATAAAPAGGGCVGGYGAGGDGAADASHGYVVDEHTVASHDMTHRGRGVTLPSTIHRHRTPRPHTHTAHVQIHPRARAHRLRIKRLLSAAASTSSSHADT